MSKIKSHYFERISTMENPDPDFSQIDGYDEEMKRQAEEADKKFISDMEKQGMNAEEFYNKGVF